MPEFKCIDPECEEQWSTRSGLAVGEECPQCGEEGRLMDAYDDEADEVATEAPALAQPRVAFARGRATAAVRDHGTTAPPVPVCDIAASVGLPVEKRAAMGDLRGRLLTDAIEVPTGDHPWVQRFSVAHELGHYFLETTHAEGSPAETEAHNFANELLVPGPMLRAAMEETPDLESLVRRFQASRPVVKIAAKHHRLPSPT